MTTRWRKLFQSIDRPPAGYQALADSLRQAIASGALEVGERLPTQRFVARHLGIAIGTVTRAYAELERLGLVVGKVGSGTYVSQYAGTGQIALGDLAQDDAGPIDMTISRPPSDGAAIHFANALRALSKRRDVGNLLGTVPPNGWLRHRVAATKWLSRSLVDIQASQIVMCNGVQHALSSIFAAFTQAGDIVATEELNYPGIKLLASLHRIRLMGIPMDEGGMRMDRLEALCRRTHVKFVLCSPNVHNPTTTTLSMERRLQLVRLARKYNFLLIENDISGMMRAEPLQTLRSLAPHETIYVSGLSKVIATGMRLGFIVASTSLLHPLMSGIRSTTWMLEPLVLDIFAMWVEEGTVDQILAWHRAEISERLDLAKRVLGADGMQFDPHCYHAWLRLPDTGSADQFVDDAYARGVSLSPSDTFAVDDSTRHLAARISLGAPNSREQLHRGLLTLADILGTGAAGGDQDSAPQVDADLSRAGLPGR